MSNRKKNQMSKDEKKLIELLLITMVLFVLAGISIHTVLNSIVISSPKVVQQNATTYNINYIVEQGYYLNDEEQVEQLIKSRENEIFGLDLLEGVEYKYYNTEISSDRTLYIFKEYYKNILIKDSDIYVAIEKDGEININGTYIEPMNFEVQPEITEGNAYEIVIEELKKESKTFSEMTRLGSKIMALKDKYIILVYEFDVSGTTIIVDAKNGKIIK